MLLGLKDNSIHCKEYKPIFYRLKNKEDLIRLEKLLLQIPLLQIYDTIGSQLAELAKIKNPQKQVSSEDVKNFISNYTQGCKMEEVGVWVYYPWSQKLVHLLDEEDFITVRTNRNMYKITPEELLVLRKQKIGIIGLSVGQAVAMNIVTERICGEIRMADFDAIELSNLNRLSNSNLFDLGSSKVIVTAQKIAELDPFIKVTCWDEGITENNIDGFLGEASSKLDILVEECDSIDIKILSRIKAREKKIPVVMDTNDKGMLDIERYDLEPQRQLLHGRIPALETMESSQIVSKLKNLTVAEKVHYLSQIIGMENVSSEMLQSLPEMGKTIVGWPQISSAVALGGAMITDTCRRIALNKLTASGRYFIHFEELINE